MGKRSASTSKGQGTLAFEGGEDPFAPDPEPTRPIARRHAGPAPPRRTLPPTPDLVEPATRPVAPLPVDAPPVVPPIASGPGEKDTAPAALPLNTPLVVPPISAPPSEPAPENHEEAPTEPSPLDPAAVRAAFGMSVRELLDPKRLVRNPDPAALFQGVDEQARRAVERERALRAPYRKMLDERLATVRNPPPHVGRHSISAADLERVARGYLYNGLTEAVYGDAVMHETVPLSIGQLGVCVIGYDGRHDQWHQRIARQELCLNLDDPVAEAEAVLNLRDRLQRPGAPNRLREFSDMARRGFVAYREREVMLTECPNRWKLGFGMPAPLEMLTGMGNMDLLEMSLELLRKLLLEDTRWIFVVSCSAEPALETLANALYEQEFAVLMRLHSRLQEQVKAAHYSRRHREQADRFVEEVGPTLVLGAFRAGALSPPRFFIAHEDRVYTAALIAMADALAVQPQGYPALVQLARAQCRVLLGGDAFTQVVQQAYRNAGAPDWAHRGEIR